MDNEKFLFDINKYCRYSNFTTSEKWVGYGHILTEDDLEYFSDPYTELSEKRIEDLLCKDIDRAMRECIKKYSKEFLFFSEPKQRGLAELAFLDPGYFQQMKSLRSAATELCDNDTWDNNKAWREHIGGLIDEI